MLKVFNCYGIHVSSHRKYKNAKKVLGKLKDNGYISAEENTPLEEKRRLREYETIEIYTSLDKLLTKHCTLILKGNKGTEELEKLDVKMGKLKEKIRKIETETSLENWYA